MRFLAIIFATSLVLCGSALAQDNKIVIKNDDGTVTEYEIPADSGHRPVAAQEPEPAPAPSPQSPQDRPAPQAKKGTQAPAPQSETANEEPAVPPAEVAEQPALQPAEEKPQEIPEASKPDAGKAPEVKKAAAQPRVPLPGRKPALQPRVIEEAANLPSDSAIPENLALQIAIRHAPPASDFQVRRRMHEGIPVYAVFFKTEQGPHVIMVDARNGEVVAD